MGSEALLSISYILSDEYIIPIDSFLMPEVSSKNNNSMCTKNFSKIILFTCLMIFEKLFLQLLLFLFGETFCIKKFKFSSRGKILKSRFLHKFVLFNRY